MFKIFGGRNVCLQTLTHVAVAFNSLRGFSWSLTDDEFIFPRATAKGSTLVGKGVWVWGLNGKSSRHRADNRHNGRDKHNELHSPFPIECKSRIYTELYAKADEKCESVRV